MAKQYEIVTAKSASQLNGKINACISEGWTPVGSHQVVTHIMQNQYAGNQHQRSLYENEYSQTMVKDE